MIDDSTQHIARISYGKDSLKMLDVIWTRGLPLDRITTTDVWATDTISANLPPMDAFKARMDQWIWDRYRIEVEHLCAVNPDGSKRTYEQMFYHVPKRRSQDVQVERERERGETGSRSSESHGVRVHSRRVLASGAIRGYPDLWNPWCQADLKRVSTPPMADRRNSHWIPSEYRVQLVPEAQERMAFPRPSLPGAESSRSTRCGPLFGWAGHDSPEENKNRGVPRHSGG